MQGRCGAKDGPGWRAGAVLFRQAQAGCLDSLARWMAAQDSGFVDQCSSWGLQERVPLRWPTLSNAPPSPKRRYRSRYVYRAGDDLLKPVARAQLSGFDLGPASNPPTFLERQGLASISRVRTSTSIDRRYSARTICSSGVWSSDESPGP